MIIVEHNYLEQNEYIDYKTKAFFPKSENKFKGKFYIVNAQNLINKDIFLKITTVKNIVLCHRLVLFTYIVLVLGMYILNSELISYFIQLEFIINWNK